MKRLRWSQTGYAAEDERVNAIASLWAEGALASIEVPGEITQARRERIGSVPPAVRSGQPDLELYAKSARVAAQWLAINAAAGFCGLLGWRSADQRLQALELIGERLEMPAAGHVSRQASNWVQRIYRQPSGADLQDRQVEDLANAWIDGQVDAREFRETLIAIQEPLGEHRVAPWPGSVADRLEAWVQAAHVSIKLLVLRSAVDYCEDQDFQSPEQRRQALESVERTLAGRSSPDRGARG
jgi:hypothetical protein